MGYEVKYKEVKKFRNAVFDTMNQWQDALVGLQEGFVELAQDSGFQGATGESIVAYIQEVHLPVISHLRQVIADLQTRFLVYEQGLTEIDASVNCFRG